MDTSNTGTPPQQIPVPDWVRVLFERHDIPEWTEELVALVMDAHNGDWTGPHEENSFLHIVYAYMERTYQLNQALDRIRELTDTDDPTISDQ